MYQGMYEFILQVFRTNCYLGLFIVTAEGDVQEHSTLLQPHTHQSPPQHEGLMEFYLCHALSCRVMTPCED